MQVRLSRFQLAKRYALAISRGVSAGSENLLVEVTHDGVTGMGEMAPTSGGARPETAETACAALESWAPRLADLSPWDMQAVESAWSPGDGFGAARAALDMALYDWQGKRCGLPVWRMLGLDRDRAPLTSVTIGINPPERVREMIPEILARTGARALKLKLGSPDGLDADRAMVAAAQESAPRAIAWRVDANGGWTVDSARSMIAWLAARGVEFVEQPLPRGSEPELAAVHEGSPLPIYVDESVYLAQDVPPLAADIDGVNIKLMKCGGIREALRIVDVARAHGLLVMFGCMSESSLAISASAQLGPLADALDLDSHLNLNPDPYSGPVMQQGRLLPPDATGLGVTAVGGVS